MGVKYAGSLRIDFWVGDAASKEFEDTCCTALIAKLIEICDDWQHHFDHKISMSRLVGGKVKPEDVEFLSENPPRRAT